MICEQCRRPFNYCFYINQEYWLKAVSAKLGHWCAHCILQKLGGLDWYIIWNQQAEKIMHERRESQEP